MSLAKVGEAMGCTREAIRQREVKALNQLRGHRDTDTLKQLYIGS
ncbi:MAG: sigma factor-like helix-turn-helix DNA-binding protein [Waterburya sp.]